MATAPAPSPAPSPAPASATALATITPPAQTIFAVDDRHTYSLLYQLQPDSLATPRPDDPPVTTSLHIMVTASINVQGGGMAVSNGTFTNGPGPIDLVLAAQDPTSGIVAADLQGFTNVLAAITGIVAGQYAAAQANAQSVKQGA